MFQRQADDTTPLRRVTLEPPLRTVCSTRRITNRTAACSTRLNSLSTACSIRRTPSRPRPTAFSVHSPEHPQTRLHQMPGSCSSRDLSLMSRPPVARSTDDAAPDPYKYVEKIAAKRSDNCLQAHGELSVAEGRCLRPAIIWMRLMRTVMTLGGNVRSDRLSLNTSFSRPPKPVGTRRFNPSRLVFDDSTDMSTPGLASPSTSDVSSRLSLLSRLSDAPTSHSWSGKYAKPAGHTTPEVILSI